MVNRKNIKHYRNSNVSKQNNDRWKLHDIYPERIYHNKVITRSQIAFILIRNTESDTALFADNTRHHPPKMTHLMNTLKGQYGAVPRTKITRELAKYVEVSETLCNTIDKYKTVIFPAIKEDKVKEKLEKATPSKISAKKQIDSTEMTTKASDKLQESADVSNKLSDEKQEKEEEKTESGEGIFSYLRNVF